MPDRYNSLPRLKLEPVEDPMQQGDVPMSAPARSTGLQELPGASPHAHCRATGVLAAQRTDWLQQDAQGADAAPSLRFSRWHITFAGCCDRRFVAGGLLQDAEAGQYPHALLIN